MIDQLLSANGLKNEDLLLFRAALTRRQLRRNTPFVSIGDRCTHLALIEAGYLRTFHIDEQGNEITTDFNQPSEFCGSYYSFYAQKPSFEIIESITDCEIYLLSYRDLQDLYAKSFQMNVFGRSILEKACIDRDLRLKKIIHLSAKEKYEWFLENYAGVYKVAKLIHIASFLGINPETLSRVRKSIIS